MSCVMGMLGYGWLWWLAVSAVLGTGAMVLMGVGYVLGVERFSDRGTREDAALNNRTGTRRTT